MRQGLQKMFLLSGVILVMGGCGNASAQVEDQMETLEESSLQQDLQTLINYEDQLQEDFETSLEGEDLSNFADSSAEVFTNVDERSAILENLRESVSTHESVNQELQEVTFQDDEAEIEDTVSSITDNLGSINGTMESFIPQYEEVLEAERSYYNSLGESSADYEDFNEGLETVNQQHESLDEHYRSLNESLTNLEENKNHAMELLSGEDES